METGFLQRNPVSKYGIPLMFSAHEDLLGYKFMLAFKGRTPPARILDWIANRRVGGFSLFRAPFIWPVMPTSCRISRLTPACPWPVGRGCVRLIFT